MDPRYGIILGPAIFFIAGMIVVLTAKPDTMQRVWTLASGGTGILLAVLTILSVLFSGHDILSALVNSISSYLPAALVTSVLVAAALRRRMERRELQRAVREISLNE